MSELSSMMSNLFSSAGPSAGAAGSVGNTGGGLLSSLGGTSSAAPARSPMEGGINTGLQLASAIPGPQQPFVAGAAALAPMVESMFGGGGGSSSPMQFPQLSRPQGQPVTPVTSPSVGNAGPLNSGAGLNPQLMRLIQMLSGGSGGLG